MEDASLARNPDLINAGQELKENKTRKKNVENNNNKKKTKFIV